MLAANLQRAVRESSENGADASACAALFQALDQECRQRLTGFLNGIEAYRRHPYHRILPAPSVFWQQGNSCLLDYGRTAQETKGPPLLLVPSLVNKAYILDLSERCSLARWLAERGLRPYLLDWGEPGEVERNFSLRDYILRLEKALTILAQKHGQPVNLLGYCMGGTLALAVAVRRVAQVHKLVLLAAPWDFHSDDGKQAELLAFLMPLLHPLMEQTGNLPIDMLQMFFTSLDPLLGFRKFSHFATLPQDGEEAQAFVALEDWLNDGVPLVKAAALDCLKGWYQDNVTGRGHWHIDGATIVPEAFPGPALSLIPQGDRIVPPESARALAVALPDCTISEPPLGHIGMIAGRKAKTEAWNLIADFLLRS